MNLSKSAETVLKQQYLKKNEAGEIVETVEDMFRRVATRYDKLTKSFFAFLLLASISILLK